MNGSNSRPTHTIGDILYDALYIAGVGGITVALFFLAYDVLTSGDAFFTPSLLGRVLFEGASAESVREVSFPAMVKYTLVHFAAFSLLGVALSWITHRAEVRSRHPVLVIVVHHGRIARRQLHQRNNCLSCTRQRIAFQQRRRGE